MTLHDGAASMLTIRPQPTFGQMCRSAFGIYRWSPIGPMAVFAVIFVATLSFGRDPGARGLEWQASLAYGLAAVGTTFCLQFLFASWIYRRARKKGPLVYTLTPAYVQCQAPGEPEETPTSWESVRYVGISSHTIYIFTSRTRAIYIVRGEHDDAMMSLVRATGVVIRGGG